MYTLSKGEFNVGFKAGIFVIGKHSFFFNDSFDRISVFKIRPFKYLTTNAKIRSLYQTQTLKIH